jgi:hypothetical protein
MSELGNFDTSGDFLAVMQRCVAYPTERVMRSVADDPLTGQSICWRENNRDLLDPQTEPFRKANLENNLRIRHGFSQPEAAVALTVYEDTLLQTQELIEAYTDSAPHAEALARITDYICSRNTMRPGSKSTSPKMRKSAYDN